MNTIAGILSFQGAQPAMEDRAPGFVRLGGGARVFFDGRLHNSVQLSRELGAASSLGDSDIVAMAWQRWGEKLVDRLLGDFAFAIWVPSDGLLCCAVDAMRARPLFYAHTNQFFAFASDEEALVGLPGVTGEPDAESLASLFIPSYVPNEASRSWLRDVRQLEPAECRTVFRDGRTNSRHYWALDAGRESRFASDGECREAFGDVFAAAVRARLPATRPSMMLSGGLDSAGIALAASRIDMGAPLRTYSAISDDVQTSLESRAIQTLQASLHSDAKVVRVPSFTGAASAADLAEIAWGAPHPNDNALLLPALLAKVAAQDGAEVLLHGAVGDTVMDVPDRYVAYLFREGRIGAGVRELRGLRRNNVYQRGASTTRLAAANLWTAFAPATLKTAAFRARGRNSTASVGVLAPEFVRDAAIAERLDAQWDHAARFRSPGPHERLALAATLMGVRGPSLGLGGYQRVGRRFGLDMADPWGDRRVVEFLLALPLDLKVRDGWTKYLLRTVLAVDLPGATAWRVDKEHLGWHFVRRVMIDSRDVVEEIVRAKLGVLEPYLDIRNVSDRYARYTRAQNQHPAFEEERQFFYSVATVAAWVGRMQAKTRSGIVSRQPSL